METYWCMKCDNEPTEESDSLCADCAEIIQSSIDEQMKKLVKVAQELYRARLVGDIE